MTPTIWSTWLGVLVAVVVLTGLGGVIAARRAATTGRVAAMRAAFTEAFGPPRLQREFDETLHRLDRAGWTTRDLSGLAPLAGDRLQRPAWHRDDLAQSLASALSLAAHGLFPGRTCEEQTLWFHALVRPAGETFDWIVPDPPPAGIGIPGDPTGAEDISDTLIVAALWDRHIGGVEAPLAVAADLPFAEAYAAHRAGTLDRAALATLAALNGRRLPEVPSLQPDTTGGRS